MKSSDPTFCEEMRQYMQATGDLSLPSLIYSMLYPLNYLQCYKIKLHVWRPSQIRSSIMFGMRLVTVDTCTALCKQINYRGRLKVVYTWKGPQPYY